MGQNLEETKLTFNSYFVFFGHIAYDLTANEKLELWSDGKFFVMEGNLLMGIVKYESTTVESESGSVFHSKHFLRIQLKSYSVGVSKITKRDHLQLLPLRSLRSCGKD